MLVLALGFGLARAAGAHCDTLEGPVARDAKIALESGNPLPALKWVKPTRDRAIRKAFEKALRDRTAGGGAREAADRIFLEALVRAHREGEGARYSGLKPAGTPLEGGVKEADEALSSGSDKALIQAVREKAARLVRARFQEVSRKSLKKDESLAAGRDYVEAYVAYVHTVERIYGALEGGTAQHEGD